MMSTNIQNFSVPILLGVLAILGSGSEVKAETVCSPEMTVQECREKVYAEQKEFLENTSVAWNKNTKSFRDALKSEPVDVAEAACLDDILAIDFSIINVDPTDAWGRAVDELKDRLSKLACDQTKRINQLADAKLEETIGQPLGQIEEVTGGVISVDYTPTTLSFDSEEEEQAAVEAEKQRLLNGLTNKIGNANSVGINQKTRRALPTEEKQNQLQKVKDMQKRFSKGVTPEELARDQEGEDDDQNN